MLSYTFVNDIETILSILRSIFLLSATAFPAIQQPTSSRRYANSTLETGQMSAWHAPRLVEFSDLTNVVFIALISKNLTAGVCVVRWRASRVQSESSGDIE